MSNIIEESGNNLSQIISELENTGGGNVVFSVIGSGEKSRECFENASAFVKNNQDLFPDLTTLWLKTLESLPGSIAGSPLYPADAIAVSLDAGRNVKGVLTSSDSYEAMEIHHCILKAME